MFKYDWHIYIIMSEEGERNNEEEVNREIDELLQLSNDGYVFERTPKWSYGTAYFYLATLDGTRKVAKKIVMDEERFKNVKKVLIKIMKEKTGRTYIPRSVVDDVAKEEGSKSKEKKEEKGGVRMGTALKELERTFAAQVVAYSKRQRWFAEVIEELGMTTLFMILQLAKIPPERWYEKIQEYKDKPDEFMKFANEYMVALFEAKQDAEMLIEYRTKYYYSLAKEGALEAELMEYKKILQDTIEQLNAATAMLPRDRLQKYVVWSTLRKISQSGGGGYMQVVDKNKGGDVNE